MVASLQSHSLKRRRFLFFIAVESQERWKEVCANFLEVSLVSLLSVGRFSSEVVRDPAVLMVPLKLKVYLD